VLTPSNVTLVNPLLLLHCNALTGPPAGSNSAEVVTGLLGNRPLVTVPAKLATGPTETSLPDTVDVPTVYPELFSQVIVPERESTLPAQLPVPAAVAVTVPWVILRLEPWQRPSFPEMLTLPDCGATFNPGEIVAEPLITQVSAPGSAACPDPAHTKAPNRTLVPASNSRRCFIRPPVCGVVPAPREDRCAAGQRLSQADRPLEKNCPKIVLSGDASYGVSAACAEAPVRLAWTAAR
jgi:hypothetical protein